MTLMKHLDSIDGVVGAVPNEERPQPSMLGVSIDLLILRLRMPDAETWIAHTVTKRALQLGEEPMYTRLSPDLQWTPTSNAMHVYHL